MKRALPFSMSALLVACACEPPATHEPSTPNESQPVKNLPVPDWSGPPLQVKSLANRGIEVEITAPTAGHTFELRSVQKEPGGASVHLLHRTSGDAIVAQVLTPLRVAVSGDLLADARRATIWIATADGVAGKPGAERLAFVIARP